MSIESLFLHDEAKVELVLPNGEPMVCGLEGPSPAYMVIYGPSTTQHQRAKEAQEKEASKRLVNLIGAQKKKEAEDKESDLKFLVAITKSVENFYKKPDGSSYSAEEIYKEPRLAYIKKQVLEFVSDMGNFYS